MSNFAETLGKNYNPQPQPQRAELNQDEQFIQNWLNNIRRRARLISTQSRRLHGYWSYPTEIDGECLFREPVQERDKVTWLLKSETKEPVGNRIQMDRYGHCFMAPPLERNKLNSYIQRVLSELINDGFKNPIFRSEVVTVELEWGYTPLYGKVRYLKHPAYVLYIDISW